MKGWQPQADGVVLRLYPVGRLDYDTEGLLIVTNDGEFTKRITHPSFEIPKTYVAELNQSITKEQINQLRTGVEIDGKKTLPARIWIASQARNDVVEITITEGRNRQVRKMFESVGLRVVHLKRTAIGKLTLGSLKVGQWRFLTDEEVKAFG